jgi:hypothetical protein
MPDTMMQPESMAARPSIADLAAALCKAQAQMEGAKKDAANPHFKSKYADLASVWDAIRAPLTSNGLSVVQLLRSIQGGVEVETILMHSSGQQISDVFAVPATKNDAQGYGSAATYARRYALMAMVGVAPEDDDGNAAVGTAGTAGTAGGGTQFRPERRGGSDWVEEARRDGTLDENRQKGKLPAAKQAVPINTPAAAGSAIKRIEWVKASVAFLNDASTDAQIAREWWVENKARTDVIETALPTEYERLLDAYNEALERKVDA